MAPRRRTHTASATALQTRRIRTYCQIRHDLISACAIMFTFVSVSHPDEIKDRKKQGKLRQHAIRAGIQRSKADRAKRDGIFVAVDGDGKKKSRQPPEGVAPPNAGSLTNAPSISLLDPFDTLCGCPERLRTLMRHRMYLSACMLHRSKLCSICEASRRGQLLYHGTMPDITNRLCRIHSQSFASRNLESQCSRVWKLYSKAH